MELIGNARKSYEECTTQMNPSIHLPRPIGHPVLQDRIVCAMKIQ